MKKNQKTTQAPKGFPVKTKLQVGYDPNAINTEGLRGGHIA
jgi:hypothetical protein